MLVDIQTRLEIGDRVHTFFDLIDRGHASKTIELLTENAAVTFGPGSPNPGTVSGEDLRQAMIAREGQTQTFTRHALSNMMFQDLGDVIEIRYLLTLYRSDNELRDPTPASVADMIERWSQHKGDWFMQSREVIPTFIQA